MLTRSEARRLYDRVGSRQDTRGWYEDPSVDVLMREGEFSDARSVFEFGFGTGRIAKRMLEETLPKDARCLGVDISTTMFGLASARLAAWQGRATVRLVSGEMPFDCPVGSFDRFLSTYVFRRWSG